ncbi:unnamed protein product [Nyctereutes procyonoides]|uniref:(raccoon dog) hypothetical protein n=1 Tax=Nyctereutes procyonoides TaxID=34880 RepID=A0A811YCB8_NYCPR|nr:unnamed protein product [Nyctereutes procyonoides]
MSRNLNEDGKAKSRKYTKAPPSATAGQKLYQRSTALSSSANSDGSEGRGTTDPCGQAPGAREGRRGGLGRGTVPGGPRRGDAFPAEGPAARTRGQAQIKSQAGPTARLQRGSEPPLLALRSAGPRLRVSAPSPGRITRPPPPTPHPPPPGSAPRARGPPTTRPGVVGEGPGTRAARSPTPAPPTPATPRPHLPGPGPQSRRFGPRAGGGGRGGAAPVGASGAADGGSGGAPAAASRK